MAGRTPDEVCELELLDTFVVDCYVREGGTESGILCPVPSCCSSCQS